MGLCEFFVVLGVLCPCSKLVSDFLNSMRNSHHILPAGKLQFILNVLDSSVNFLQYPGVCTCVSAVCVLCAHVRVCVCGVHMRMCVGMCMCVFLCYLF